MAVKLSASAVCVLQDMPLCRRTQSCVMSFKPNQLRHKALKIFCSMNMAAGESDDPVKLSMGLILGKTRSLWDSSPQPVKSFPWNKTLENFIQVILDLFLIVVKYLSIPLFAITSVSEMSYCAHERKLYTVPLPFLAGIAVAGVLSEAALDSSPYLKKAEVPWHLISILIFFTLLKLPGPYYPYWGRIFIPHMANGAIWRTLWFTFLWYRRHRESEDPK